MSTYRTQVPFPMIFVGAFFFLPMAFSGQFPQWLNPVWAVEVDYLLFYPHFLLQ